MKVCPSCGFHNADDAMFCEECGARLNAAPTPPPQTGAGQQPAGGGQSGPQSNAQGWSGGQSQAKGWSGGQTGPQGTAKGWAGGQSAPVAGTAPVRRPRKPMKKPGKNHIIAALEALALVIAIVVFCVVGSSRTSPTRVAEQYFRAMLDGDWAQICQLADVPDSPFLTREAFERCLGEYEIYQRELANLTAREDRDYQDYQNQGGMGDYVREVEVEYVYKDSPEVYSEDVTLMRSDSREMFFFRSWKVVDNLPFLARGFQVEVPTGATLVVDGLVADESMCVEHWEATDVYSLDLFVGTHDFTVVTPLGSQSQSYEVWQSDDYLYAGDVAVTENLQNQLEGQTKTLLEQMFNAALANSDFSAISGSYTGDALEIQMPEYYSEMREAFFGTENWRMLKITLSNFEVWNCYSYYDEEGQLWAYLELEFDTTYESAWLENSYLQSTDTNQSYGSISLEFLYQDGNWIPANVWNLYW